MPALNLRLAGGHMDPFEDALGPGAVVITATGHFALSRQVNEATHRAWTGSAPCPCRDCEIKAARVIPFPKRVRQPWEAKSRAA